MKSSLGKNQKVYKENDESNYKSIIDKKKSIFLLNSEKNKNIIIFPKIEKTQNKILENKKTDEIILQININFPFDKTTLKKCLEELKNLQSKNNLKNKFLHNSIFLDLNKSPPILHIKKPIGNEEEEINIFKENLLRFENFKKKEVMEKIILKKIRYLKKFWKDRNCNYPFVFRKIEDFMKNETIDISHKEILLKKN